MRRKINLIETFKVLRQEPLDVSIQKVEYWVAQHARQHSLPHQETWFNRLLKWWLKR